jgi:hypothetical protein
MKLRILLIITVLLCSSFNENALCTKGQKHKSAVLNQPTTVEVATNTNERNEENQGFWKRLQRIKEYIPESIRNYRPLQAMLIGTGLWAASTLVSMGVAHANPEWANSHDAWAFIPFAGFASSFVIGGTGFLVMLKDGYGYLWRFAGG